MNLNVETGIILCAGKGTRMGKIGKVLPKPLWPFFYETMLSFQIKQLKKIGVKKIILNTHHCSELIQRYVHSLKDSSVICVHEKEILGSGGGITNILKKNTELTGFILLMNCDMFIDFKEFQLKELCQLKMKFDKVLLATPVNGLKYNRLIVDGNILKDILSPENFRKKYHKKDDGFPYTYSGCGIFKVESILKSSEYSRFFDSVSNYKQEEIYCYNLEKHQSFDFGTHELYFENILDLKNNSLLKQFLEKNNIVWTKNEVRDGVFYFGQNQKHYKVKMSDTSFLEILKKNIKGERIIILNSKNSNFIYSKSGIYYNEIMN